VTFGRLWPAKSHTTIMAGGCGTQPGGEM
jgi:hypothetical protein